MTRERKLHRKAGSDHRWDGVELLPYKEDARALFKSVTRQVLFADPEMHAELQRGMDDARGVSRPDLSSRY